MRLDARRNDMALWSGDALGLPMQIFDVIVAVAFLFADRQFLRIGLEG